jgi:VIT1/CCC1 family predicted Fe2+/Mn2+ transporter
LTVELEQMETIQHFHDELWHTPRGRSIREIIFGMNDGLVTTVGFLAGVTSSLAHNRTILLAGIAEVFAGAISMAIGGYLATKSQREFFQSEIERERWEIEKMPDKEKQEIRDLSGQMGFKPEEQTMIVNRVSSDKALWLRFMMREELGLFDENFDKPLSVAVTMGFAFLVGSLPPLLPYVFLNQAQSALVVSVIVAVLFLFVAGVAKTRLTKAKPLHSALEMTLLGVTASAVGFVVGHLASVLIQ